MLRALAGIGCFIERSHGQFEITLLGLTLGDYAPVSLRGAASMIGADWHWQTWSALEYSVTSGRPAFEFLFGCDFQQYYQEHAGVREQFNRASRDLAILSDSAILAAYDFTPFAHVVHLANGGGDGGLIAKLLQRNPHIEATFCDLPSVVESARRTMVQHGVEERCRLHSWQDHEPLPSAGEVYVLRNVLRDMNDSRALEALDRYAHTVGPNARLLLVEMLVPEDDSLSLAKILDIDAMLFTGGQERTLAQYRSLLSAAGFNVLRVISTAGPLSIIECTRGRDGDCGPSPQSSSPAASTMEIGDSMPPHLKLVRMLGSFRIARMISLACRLGFADCLRMGPLSVQSLAERTGCEPQALFRVLRALAGFGIFTENARGEIALTPRATYLRSDVHGSVYRCALVFGEAWHWHMWGRLLDTVRTGKPAFDAIHGRSFYSKCQHDPEFAKQIDSSKASIYSSADDAILAAYDFSSIKKLVHVGAGNASLTVRILAANPTVEAVAFDIASSRAETQRVIEANHLSDRCRVVSGTLFDQIPAGDTILLRGVIHYWDDESAITILRNCRAALLPHGRLVIAEMLMPHNNEMFVGKFIDVESLLLTEGGRERSEAEYRKLLEDSGFTVNAVIGTQTPISIIEACHAAQ